MLILITWFKWLIHLSNYRYNEEDRLANKSNVYAKGTCGLEKGTKVHVVVDNMHMCKSRGGSVTLTSKIFL